MNLFDTHCHLQVHAFDADREAVIARARAAGVIGMAVPGIHLDDLASVLAVCRAHEGLYPALGLHPIYLDRHRREDVDALAELAARERPVALGEIGLDYFVRELDRARQQWLFEAQLALAGDAGLPVLLHVRKAHDEVLATLRRMRFPHGGVAHAFSGSRQQAEQYIGLGFKLGFGGVMTFERAKRIRRLARELPLTAIVLETDAPDLPPAAHRDGRNSPEYLPEILATLAELRDADPEEVARQTTANARAMLRLD
jgi:TatD DNase family protein